jgi:hypothetical protein
MLLKANNKHTLHFQLGYLMLVLSEALLLFNEEVKTPHNKGEYRNPN